jgi:release factor glutamine methyltransferase
MQIKEALTQAVQILAQHSSTPETDALYLLMALTKKNGAWLFLHADEQLNLTEEFFQLVRQRAQGIPIAYLTHVRGFWTVDLIVNEHVLIPRPETERLVELTLEFLSATAPCKVADLGTGSGAIALSLAHERPHWHIDAVDDSFAALKIARDNAQKLQLTSVHFYEGLWCEALPEKNYDALISNPPYLQADDPHLLQGDLRFEPRHALVAGITGLEAYELISKQAKNYLKPRGLLLLEHGYDQREALINILTVAGYHNIRTYDDYAGIPRNIIASAK